MYNRSKVATSLSENVLRAEEHPSALVDVGRRKHQAQQQRQLLSCTKCRERKVKCDRTKPCSACCARGQPKECHFVAEGGDYAPISQSYELRKLRTENLRLKERLRASELALEDDDLDQVASPDSRQSDNAANRFHKRRSTKQKRFQSSESTDSIYFGSPGLANVINEFASINIAPTQLTMQSLTHAMPRGVDMYAPKDLPLYPFATLFSWSLEKCIPELLGCLPPREELFSYLQAFHDRVHVCFFPHIPTEITKSEVERFLDEDRKNADACPEMLALLFAALALGSQHGVWDKCGGKWVVGAVEKESQRGNLYIAAAMQALRMSSFMNRPTLLGIQALIMIGPYLTNSGRFLDAWTLFGTTIRLAQSIGLHRHPKYLDPAPTTQQECSIRQTVWWWMLHMDQQYSMTLGRPLGISGLGDCPPPHELTTNPTFLRFGDFVHQFTLLARVILSSDRLSNQKIDQFTDDLRNLLDTMPEQLQFDDDWLDEEREIPEWPLGAMAAVFYCKTQNYLILLNRQRVDKPAPCKDVHPPSLSATRVSSPSFHPVNPYCSSYPTPTSTTAPASPIKTPLRGRPLVLAASDDLLTAFLFFYARVPAALICWTVGQQAFNSCMILILDAMETGDFSRMRKVEKAYYVFTELDKKCVHKLANLAVDKISWGITELRRMQEEAAASIKRGLNPESRPGPKSRSADSQAASVGSEAMVAPISCPNAMHDTVMGNTGMLLLEDPGLQAFVSEAFSPFTWEMAGDELEGASPMQLKLEEEQHHHHQELLQQKHSERPTYAQASRESTAGFDTKRQHVSSRALGRSTHNLHGTQGSESGPGSSGPLQFATFGGNTGTTTIQALLPQERMKPQGLTSPTSPTSAALPISLSQSHHQRRFHGTNTAERNHAQEPPPQLRHHSFPSLRENVPSPLVPHPPYGCTAPNGEHGSPNLGSPVSQGQMSPTTYLGPPSPAPQPQRLYTVQEQNAHFNLSHGTGNPSVHPLWAARPAAPINSASEPSGDFPHTFHVTLPQHNFTAEGYQYTFPLHVSTMRHSASSAVSTGAGATAGATSNDADIEQWRALFESSRAV